jgi:hypothetical protein
MMINPASGGSQKMDLLSGGDKMTRHYSIQLSRIQKISDKADALTRWLAENTLNCEASQRHLDPGTIEQTYWHYGYLCALRDILALVDSGSTE